VPLTRHKTMGRRTRGARQKPLAPLAILFCRYRGV
jgi:hypothetical protein